MSDNRRQAVLIDIDGVICYTDYKPTPENFDWEKFCNAVHHPIEAGIKLVHGFINGGMYPVFLTARPWFMREQTEKMLAEWGFHGVCYMADNNTINNHYEDYQVLQMEQKKDTLRTLQKEFNFLYAIDDQEPNAKMFKELGIPTLQARFI